VCDEVISLHHEVIRKQLHTHHGYECGTEGDAFVLAFHTAADALLFATQAQLELLLADWPAQLLELEVCRPVYVSLPMTLDRQQSDFMKHMRKSGSQMSFGRQDSISALQIWSSQEVALDSTFANTQVSFKQQSPHMESTSEVSVRSMGQGFLSKLRACFLCRTLQQKSQARSGQPHPLSTPQLSLAEDADTSVYKRYAAADASPRGAPEVHQLRGRSSGLLAFDAALFSTAMNNGLLRKQSKESDEEMGLDCTKPVKRFPSRSSVTPFPTPFHGDSSHSFRFDPAMSPPCLSGLGSSLTPDASTPRVPASNNSNTEQSGSRRVQFSAFEPGCSTQDDNYAIETPGTHHAIPESSKGSGTDNTKLTVGQQYLATMPRTHTPGPCRLLVLRGLRVRMGAASGLERQEDVQMKGAQGRAQYSGPAMAAAKAVVDAAQGGMVLISPETFQQIPAKLLRKKLLVASMGEHMLGKGQEQVCMQLYQVLPRELVHRAPHLGPVRSIHQLSHGFLEAPSNSAAICFMSVSYLKALELWNPDVTAAALEQWHTTVQGILTKRGGYLVEAVDGLCLAAFTCPSSAIRWALESIEACLNADWPSELLETELGEEQFYSPLQSRSIRPQYSERDQQVLSISSSMGSASMKRPVHFKGVLLFRGLRLKVGIDWGAVKADLHAATARVTFRGRVMNRAARISSVAKCGQVWCSEGAWEAAAQDINSPEAFPNEIIEEGEDDTTDGVNTMHGDGHLANPKIQFVHVTPLGPHQLKGIAQHVELYHCY